MRRRTVARGSIASPSWSPDGRHLLFARMSEGGSGPKDFRLFVVGVDGAGERQVSDEPYLFPIWLD
jgi:Tol biopolymer transport system component